MNISTTEKYALVLAPMAYTGKIGTVLEKDWGTLEHIARGTELLTNPSIRIQLNVWLIPLHTKLPLLGLLIHSAQEACIPIHVLFLEGTPNWLKLPPDATAAVPKSSSS